MICVPIVSPSMKESLADIAAAREFADIIELRVDLMQDFDLPALLKAAGRPCIVTNRTKLEGGQFRGTEELRVRVLRQAIDAGADFIDIEASTPRHLLKSVLESKGSSRTILSYHDFTRTPDRLETLYEMMRELPADVLKIVVYATDINDNLAVFDLLKRASRDGRRLISFCMGEKGEISRILSPLMGGFLTFGSLDAGKESAPGQIPAERLKDVYRVDRPREGMKIYGVIGDPVSKSMGYLIHNRAFQESGLPHIYVPFRVKNLQKFFAGFESVFAGLSVTMPFKEEIVPLLGKVDPVARKIGAVNTVAREGNVWTGHNTDCSGALKALEEIAPLAGKNVLIVGAGGTAKAIGHGVAGRGARLTLTYNRDKNRGEVLARELQCRLVSVRDIEDCPADVLINCSPAGMAPKVNETPVPARALRPGMVVFDSVYNPPETRLIREAKAAGCATISGIELFINQGAAQFELWTGMKAPVAAMRSALTTALGG
ncbi:MAG: shikimate dehydrogenase [Nitrospinae bacterium]|nr:shikimate dehydrogenase [Nitrospinota bacterium]